MARSRNNKTESRLGRLGRWAANHMRTVVLVWIGVALCLGLFAPRAEHVLSGGGWQADGSESVAARGLIERHFGGQGSYALAIVVSSARHTSGDPVFRRAIATAANVLRSEPDVASVQLPRPGEVADREPVDPLDGRKASGGVEDRVARALAIGAPPALAARRSRCQSARSGSFAACQGHTT